MLVALLIITYIFVLLRLVPHKHWIFQMPVYLAIQSSFVILSLLVLNLFFSEGLTLGNMIIYAIGLVILWWQGREIIPYFKFYKPTVQGCASSKHEYNLKVLVSNVLIENRAYDKVADMIVSEQAELVTLLETDQTWVTELKARLANAPYPYEIILPREDGYGIIILSQFPIENKKVLRVYNETPAVHFTLKNDGIETEIFVLHPMPPVFPEAQTAEPKDEEFKYVGEYIRHLPEDRRIIILGDMNDVAWSKTTKSFLKRSGLFDPRVGRGIMPTFPAWAPIMGFPLDHIFVSKHYRIHELKRMHHVGSDHFPIMVKLCNGA